MLATLDHLKLINHQAWIEADEIPLQSFTCVGQVTNQIITRRPETQEVIPAISLAARGHGSPMRLLKTNLTSACERNCAYCSFRAGRDFRRATLNPDEMANLYHRMAIAGLVDGLFLSSGIAGGGIHTQDLLIDTIEILRFKYQYSGYIHLKIMPGAEKDQVSRVLQLANRVSVNLEAPDPVHLSHIAPLKKFDEELLLPLQTAQSFRDGKKQQGQPNHRNPSLVTQFVVGGTDETDRDLLNFSEYLFRSLKLSRIYYSAFSPISDTPLFSRPPENPLREIRLYQASFLLRDYAFSKDELAFNKEGFLPLEIDPKLAYAKANYQDKPLEVNKASKEQLLRIPGLGKKSVDLILRTRVKNPFKQLGDLRRLGIHSSRSAPFILLNGKRPEIQPELWED